MATRLSDYDTSVEEEGILRFDGRWYLLGVTDEFHQRILQLSDARCLDLKPSRRPHISVIKGEVASQNQPDWGSYEGEKVKFKFDPTIHCENGVHVWINIWSKRLCQIREHFGLVTLRRRDDGMYLVNFHMTLGKLRKPRRAKLRAQLRLNPQSHIDAETGMQHL